MTTKHPILFDFTYKGKDIYITPRQIIEALRYSSQELSYSNYHHSQMDRAEKIIRQWCRDNHISLGPTEAAVKKRSDAWHERLSRDLQSTDLKIVARALKRAERRNK